MQAYYEIETEIPDNHQLNIQLPADIPAGKAKVAVIYELTALQATKGHSSINANEPLETDSLIDDPLDIQKAVSEQWDKQQKQLELEAFFKPFQTDLNGFKFDRDEANAR